MLNAIRRYSRFGDGGLDRFLRVCCIGFLALNMPLRAVAEIRKVVIVYEQEHIATDGEFIREEYRVPISEFFGLPVTSTASPHQSPVSQNEAVERAVSFLRRRGAGVMSLRVLALDHFGCRGFYILEFEYEGRAGLASASVIVLMNGDVIEPKTFRCYPSPQRESTLGTRLIWAFGWRWNGSSRSY